MDFGLDPVQCVAHQPHAMRRVEALDRLHQTDIAFLNQVGMGQTVAKILPRGGHDQPQVREHQLSGGVLVALLAPGARQPRLFLGAEHGQAVDRADIGVDVAQVGKADGKCPINLRRAQGHCD
ncbi:hypothetical protein GALL_553230 [mine drainage metagenome]|uniref:Uncharacterized protein n=1 Tax=mine drainage metagenome TaxID=410659 RepID=A0A1J5NWK4_9ZZZZ